MRYAIFSTYDTVKNINSTFENIQNKIIEYKNGYLNKFVVICLQEELVSLKKQTVVR
jgi:hypothetical protein